MTAAALLGVVTSYTGHSQITEKQHLHTRAHWCKHYSYVWLAERLKMKGRTKTDCSSQLPLSVITTAKAATQSSTCSEQAGVHSTTRTCRQKPKKHDSWKWNPTPAGVGWISRDGDGLDNIPTTTGVDNHVKAVWKPGWGVEVKIGCDDKVMNLLY